MQTHDLRLVDTNGYTVNARGAVRYAVPTDQVEAVAAELHALAESDARKVRALHLQHAYAVETTDAASAASHRSAATRIHACDYRVTVDPPVV